MTEQLATHAVYEPASVDGVVWEARFPAATPDTTWVWRHLDLVNPRARHDIDTDDTWPAMIRRIVTGADEAPRIVADDDAIGGVLPSFARTGDSDEFSVTVWHFAASPSRLLTARRHSARSLAAAYHLSRNHPTPPDNPISMIHLAITDFCRATRARIAMLEDELDAVESILLAYRRSTVAADLASRIGQVRREMVDIRRALAPVTRAMTDARDEWPEWAVVDEHESTLAAVMGVLDDITALNERGRSLQDELTSRQTDETNRRLYVVSVVTTLMMPATFVTGFFGMNTGGFLWGEGSSHGTLYAGLACLAAVLVMVGLLKWRRLM